MTMPIVIRRPKLLLQKLDATGEPTIDPPVDVSCDVIAVELVPEQDIERTETFCGSFPLVGDVETTATITAVATADTSSNWAPLIGSSVEARLYDRHDSTKYRKFRTEIPFDPSLYGPTDATEDVRSFDFDVPVYEGPEWENVV